MVVCPHFLRVPIFSDSDALDGLIGEAARLSRRSSLSQQVRDGAYSAWTYFNNHRHQMNYPEFLAEHLPIGSGVTEAACKTLVKQRLCASGMRWKNKGAGIVLSLRALTQTVGRWTQFWERSINSGRNAIVEHIMLGPHPLHLRPLLPSLNFRLF